MASPDLRLSVSPGDLDALADSVAAALDAGDDVTAWDIVVALEELTGPLDDDVRPPAAPVIARRFARAHQRILGGGGRILSRCATRDG